MNKDETIQSLVSRLEIQYITGYTKPSKYVTVYFSEEMNRIYAYLESQFTEGGRVGNATSGTLSENLGDKDSMGRDKPFFNIVLAARNIWFRATDLDRKDIKIKASKASDTLIAFVATAILSDWMKRENFGQFLNDWGLNMAGFNETITKFVKQDGRLIPSVVPWNRVICDPINFEQNPVIEVLEMTEAELRNHIGYNQDKVDMLISTAKPRETIEKQRKDNKQGYIKLYEVHGMFSKKIYKQGMGIEEDNQTQDEADQKIFFQQMHVIACVPVGDKGDYSDFTLFCGKEDNPYLLTALLPELDGSIALRGSVKNLFTAQWMVNHSVKAIKDQLDLASKLIFQTADGNFVGQNALMAIETGDILIHAPNQPLTVIANASHDISSLQNFSSMWQTLANQLAGISEAMMGKNPGSNVSGEQTKTLLAENHSLFDIMTQNKGLFVEKMMRQFILPFIKSNLLKNSKEIVTTLDSYGISKLDASYISQEAVKRMMNKDIQAILNGQQPQQDLPGAQQEVQQELTIQGGERYITPSKVKKTNWATIFKDFEWDVDCDITGEDDLSSEDVANLISILQTISNNPRVLTDPNAKLVFNTALTAMGAISPLQLQAGQPFIPLPIKRLTETIDYKDAPPSIRRQMEAQEGFTPATDDITPASTSIMLKSPIQPTTPVQPNNAAAPPTVPASMVGTQ